jgi:hypothetical protein
VAWGIGGGIFATGYWAIRNLTSDDKVKWWDCVETVSYYDNLFEYHAYMENNPGGYSQAPVPELTY